MNTNELLLIIQTLKETGFSHIDLNHEGSRVLLSNADFPVMGSSNASTQAGAVSALTKQMSGDGAGLTHEAFVAHGHGHTSNHLAPLVQTASIQTESTDKEPGALNTPEGQDSIKGGHIVESPIVGTYYGSANPESEPFVTIGSKVKKGQVLCIIEAMKLMNEIESDVDGQVVEILVNNEDGVEYGQPLFRIV